MGTNLIWHFRGEEKGDKWEPEVFLYRGNGSTSKPDLAVDGMAGIILAWAHNADGTKADDSFVANGMSYTGVFYSGSVAFGEALAALGGTYFTGRDKEVYCYFLANTFGFKQY